MTNYKGFHDYVDQYGLIHALQPGERAVSLVSAVVMTTAGVTLHNLGNANYKPGTGKEFIATGVSYITNVGNKTMTLEQSDDVDASTNPVTIAIFITPAGIQNHLLTYVAITGIGSLDTVACASGKYLNIKVNGTGNSPKIMAVVGYERDT